MSNLPSLARPRRELSVHTLVSAFESETVSVFVRTTPYSEHLLLYILLAMMTLSVVLISVAKIDRIVSGTGRVISSEGSLYVQPLDRSIVRNIRVKVGDVVKKDQVLATLDPTFAGADLAQLEAQVASATAQVARLEAELADKPYAPTGTDKDSAIQEAIWKQRQAEYKSSLADFDARIASDGAKVTRLEQDADNFRQRLKVASDIEKMNTTLEHDGWGSRLKTLTATDTRVEVTRLLSQSENEIKESRQDQQALQAQRAVYVEKWHSDVGAQLVTERDTLSKAQEDLKKAQKVNQLVSLTAPADAIVLKVGNASVGSVVGPTADPSQGPLFTLVPLNDALEAEVDIDAKDIGYIQPGDPVEVKLDAYDFLRHGTAKGKIETISEGSFTTGDDNQVRAPYFKARVALTDVNLHDVPASFRLIPGMTLVSDIMIGKRTILSYIVEGALRTGSEAMREP